MVPTLIRSIAATLIAVLIQGPSVYAQTGLPVADHVIVVGIDGLMPAGIHNAKTPVLDSLILRSAYSFKCEAVLPTSSSPNWASMIMGASPSLHGITSNAWEPGNDTIPLECTGTDAKGKATGMWPTLFSVLRQQRPESVIGVFHDWRGFGRLVEEGVADRKRNACPLSKLFDRGHKNVIRRASHYFSRKTPDLLFLHLDHVDHAGHEHGYGSDAYNQAVEEADRLIGVLLQHVEKSGKMERTVVLITSDHGGVGMGHGGDSDAERLVPWILVGKKLAHGELNVPIRTYDTAATLAHILRIAPPACWRGKTIHQAFLQ